MSYMNLEKISIGSPSPEWLKSIYRFIVTADEHDHSEGRGKILYNDSLNIDADIDFNRNLVVDASGVYFQNTLDPSEIPIHSLFFYEDELWVSTGNYNLQLTAGGSFNSALVGGLAGDYGGTNIVTYTDADETYYFTVASNPADIKVKGVYITGTDPVTSVYLSLEEVAGSDTSWTFPSTPPTSESLIQIDSLGDISYIDNGVTGNFFINVNTSNEIVYEPITFDFIETEAGQEYKPLRYNSSGVPVIDCDEPIMFPKGNTAERPLSPPNGALRFNEDTSTLEVYKGDWESLIFLSESGLVLNNLTDVSIDPALGSGILKYDSANSEWVVEEFTQLDYSTQIGNRPTNVTDLSLHSISELGDVHDQYRLGDDINEISDKTDLILKYFSTAPEGFYLTHNISNNVNWAGVTGNPYDQYDIYNPSFTTFDYDLEGNSPGLFNFMITVDEIPYDDWLTGFPTPWVERDASIFSFANVVPDKEDLTEGDTLYAVNLTQEGKPDRLGLNNAPLPEGGTPITFTYTGSLLTHDGTGLYVLEPPESGTLAILKSDPTSPCGLRWETNEPDSISIKDTLGQALYLDTVDEVRTLSFDSYPAGGEPPLYEVDLYAKLGLNCRLRLDSGATLSVSILGVNKGSKWLEYEKGTEYEEAFIADGSENILSPRPAGSVDLSEQTVTGEDDRVFYKSKFLTDEDFSSTTLELVRLSTPPDPKTSFMSFTSLLDFSNSLHVQEYILPALVTNLGWYEDTMLVDPPYIYFRNAERGGEGETYPGGYISNNTERGIVKISRIELPSLTVTETFSGYLSNYSPDYGGTPYVSQDTAGFNPIRAGVRLGGSSYLYYSGISNVHPGGFLVWGESPEDPSFRGASSVDLDPLFYDRAVFKFSSSPSSVFVPVWATDRVSNQAVFPNVGYKNIFTEQVGGFFGFGSNTWYTQRYHSIAATQMPTATDVRCIQQNNDFVGICHRNDSSLTLTVIYNHNAYQYPDFQLSDPSSNPVDSDDSDIHILKTGIGAIGVIYTATFKGLVYYKSDRDNFPYMLEHLSNLPNPLFIEDTHNKIPSSPRIIGITYTGNGDVDEIYIKSSLPTLNNPKLIVIKYSDIAISEAPEGEVKMFVRRNAGGGA